MPIYSGVTELPLEWGATGLTIFDDSFPFWSMQLPGRLAMAKWQSAYADIKGVRQPPETTFRNEQSSVLQQISSLSSSDAAKWLNTYTQKRLDAVVEGFAALTDYILSAYYFYLGPVPLPQLPKIAVQP